MDKKAGNSSFMGYTGGFLVMLILFLFTPFSPTHALTGINNTEPSGAIQRQKVKGKITDENGNPVPGASVIVKGTTQGTVSDTDGNFEIEVSAPSTLLISSIGFEDQEIQVSGSTSDLKVSLKEKIQFLNEIVVIGYGSQKKETVTGSISTVSSEDLIRQPVTDLSQALVGRMPGLVALNPGGRPGKENNTMYVRGRGTFGDASPLIMIDGIERDQNALISLDPNEIEGISMLKDASATAVFGVRGANGVILVTTKRGQVGPAKVNYTGNFALIQPYEKLNLINSYTQTGLANEFMGFPANTDDPTAPFPVSIRDRYKGVVEGNPVNATDPFFYPSTDYEDLMLKNHTTQQQHNLTVSGGTDIVKYFASLGYFNQGGLFSNLNRDLDVSTNYNRYNYRSNIDINASKSTIIRANIGGSFNRNINLGQPEVEPMTSYYWNMFVHSSPWDGYMHDGKVVLNKENANSVLLNSDMRGYNLETQNTADYTVVLDQKLNFILDGLALKATSSFINYFQNYVRRDIDERYIPTWKPNLNPDGTVTFYKNKDLVIPNNGTSQKKNRKEYYELALNYEYSNVKHKVTALLLANAEKTNYQYSQYYFTPRSYIGFVGRVTYNYGNKYLAELNAGYNGSENFAEGKRFGIFPSLSLGWTFSEESFIKSVVSSKIFSYGKIRFSYGIVGNDKLIDPNRNPLRFLYLPGTAYMNNGSYNGWWESGGPNFGLPGSINSNMVAYQGKPGNPNVTWESAVKINYGIDLSFIDGKLKASFDYFTDERTDILIEQNVVPVYQETGKLPLNLGKHSNKGYEIQVGWNSSINENSRIWADASYTFARNKMKEIDEPQKMFDYQMQTGRRIGEIWGFQQEGIIMTDEDAISYREQLWDVYKSKNPSANFADYKAYQLFSGSDVTAGDLKYIDRNNDGVITDLDQGYLNIVNFPESMFALNIGYQYKGLSISTLWQGASNFSINVRGYYMPSPIRGSMRDFMLNRYTRERYEAGENVEYPALTNAHNNWEKLGSFWYRDASYLRLKSMEVGYTFKSINKLVFNELMFYVNGMNLFTISNIKTLDPETRDGQITYPRSRIFNIGVRAQF